LKALRNAKGLSQRRLALLSGLGSVAHVLHIERGMIRYPQANTLSRLAAGLGVPMEALMCRNSEDALKYLQGTRAGTAAG
jgi:transcriptional regulator with XRE-family HTH domain